ncbi:MAG TPA: class II aldolase/adducin family protein [Phenylobacterium sp.]|jgi:ribulose-5-phosphate 4-epimerase/fuculose-1-phosphate aldolase|uniref:Class II aldolase/adducin family protein n=1 Tax=Phenylobacterium conjunctum TaxID=1298959 RepID=A0ABW3SZ33_9CAUL|nr:class II aldolase/adducin family protein [Phenylobacterium sp.]HQN50359.1 class II aldolase/adducin family protein [Phenylobacterium sp.]HQP20031.1 class II aldolase/adducin family protein [Phenylobacterium sp.]
MADGSLAGITSLKGKVSAEEWEARVDLAALYRLVALNGWDDMIYTHISARIPGPEHHFLINPYGMFFGEITASSLVKIDLDGNILQDTPYFINPAGFTIHSAIHSAREDAMFVMHLHTDQGVAVAAQKEGLLPLSQHALICLPKLAYHDYEGIALNLDERERLIADVGDKPMVLLRNHGTLTTGETASDCWLNMYYLERACKMQIMALSGGRENVLIAPDAAQAEVRGQTMRGLGGKLAWPGNLRRLDKESPGYDA